MIPRPPFRFVPQPRLVLGICLASLTMQTGCDQKSPESRAPQTQSKPSTPTPSSEKLASVNPAQGQKPATTTAKPGVGKPAPSMLPGGPTAWNLIWSDEFDYTDKELDKHWESQNGPSGHILCSRWRGNVVASNGTLKLLNRKEKRGGQEWTSGNIWTKKHFLYGYFECRYRYAAATGTNNSFWLMTRGGHPEKGKRFEIDINEGHYPNIVNTNIHNWSDIKVVNGKKTHWSSHRKFQFGARHDISIQLETPVTTRRVRLHSTHPSHFHLSEFRIYNVNPAGYPAVMQANADKAVPGLVNYAAASSTKITASGEFQADAPSKLPNLIDGNPLKTWVSQKDGDKWVEFTLAEEQSIGCIQFVSGFKNKNNWQGQPANYKIEYHNGQDWIEMAAYDEKSGPVNFARDFHTFGLEWTPDALVYFLDGKEIRREKNTLAYSPSPIWLSLAIIPWGGKITDAIDGTAMEVDFVRVYQRKSPTNSPPPVQSAGSGT